MKQSIGELHVQMQNMFDFMKDTRNEMAIMHEQMATKKDFTEILEIVTFIKDTAATREELFEVRNELDHRLTRVESLMVTKDYLDDKLADLRGDMVSFVHKKLART